MKKDFFEYREVSDGYCLIVPKDYDSFPWDTSKGGSYALAPARVLGLDYPTYLRFVRDMFPNAVQLRGKNQKYVLAYWRKGAELSTFIKLLNNKLSLAVTDAKI